MLMEFAGLQLTRGELKEIHRALLLRAFVREELRKEKGIEGEEPNPLLDRIEALVGETEERLHALDHEVEDELWEYSWYAFTEEWAWFRARQEAEKELRERGQELSEGAVQKLLELKYHKNFDAYVAEIDMLEDSGSKKRKAVAPPQQSRSK